MPTTFKVEGPFTVPCDVLPGGKCFTRAHGKELFASSAKLQDLADRKGVYVFAVRAGKGVRPVYVGKTAKSFSDEAFTHHKLQKYQRGLSKKRKGTPVMYFITPATSSKTPKNSIDELETFIIQSAMQVNPGIENDRKKKVATWSIAGVLRNGAGKRSAAAKSLCETLKL